MVHSPMAGLRRHPPGAGNQVGAGQAGERPGERVFPSRPVVVVWVVVLLFFFLQVHLLSGDEVATSGGHRSTRRWRLSGVPVTLCGCSSSHTHAHTRILVLHLGGQLKLVNSNARVRTHTRVLTCAALCPCMSVPLLLSACVLWLHLTLFTSSTSAPSYAPVRSHAHRHTHTPGLSAGVPPALIYLCRASGSSPASCKQTSISGSGTRCACLLDSISWQLWSCWAHVSLRSRTPSARLLLCCSMVVFSCSALTGSAVLPLDCGLLVCVCCSSPGFCSSSAGLKHHPSPPPPVPHSVSLPLLWS